jgi:beta-xylosidase
MFRAVATVLLCCLHSLLLSQRLADSRLLPLRATVEPLPYLSRIPGEMASRNFFADPEILRYNGLYYLFATSNTSSNHWLAPEAPLGIRCLSSPDLKHWTDRGQALDAKNPDYVTWSEDLFWSPQVIHNPADGKFYLFYNSAGGGYIRSKRRDSKRGNSPYQRICVARADEPQGPYKEFRAPLFDKECMPGWIDGEKGIIGTIDACAFVDEQKGKPTRFYLYWSAIDDDRNQNTLWGGELKPDFSGLKADPAPRELLGKHVQKWETKSCGDRLIQEAPSLIHRADQYYMLYSANSYNTADYGMGLAMADSPLGPFRKYRKNPVVHTRGKVEYPLKKSVVLGPGGGSFFSTGESGAVHIVYHSIVSRTTEPLCSNNIGHFRQVRIATLELP